MNDIANLRQIIEERNEKLSKAKLVKSLLQKQKGLLKSKQSLTDFQEPVLFLVRRDGKMNIFEKASAGKFVIEHSNGTSRYIELRPSDQITFDYANKKVRGYVAHEDRPFAGWDDPVVDAETVMLGYEKTKATDLKYQQRIEELKNKGKLTWVYIIIGLAIAVAIAAFAYNSWIAPAMRQNAEAAAKTAAQTMPGIILLIKAKLNSNV